MTDPSGTRDKLAQLGERFLQRTLGELASLKKAVERVRAGEPGALEDLRHLTHRMHGTGATLGFVAISEHAGRIEKLVEASAPDSAQLARYAEELEEAILVAAQERGINI